MKKVILSFLILMCSSFLFAQQVVFDFESAAADSLFKENIEGVPASGPLAYMTFEDDSTDFVEGSASLKVKYVIGAFHPWGSFGNAIQRIDDETEPLMDFSGREYLSIWIKVQTKPVNPEYMLFRVHLLDKPTVDLDYEEYIYEHTTLIDTTTDWFELKIPLVDLETGGAEVPNDQGFSLFPDAWTRSHENNKKLDFNKIFGMNLSAVTSGWTDPNNIPADSVVVSYDNMTLQGHKATPVVVFNGKVVNTIFTASPWGQSSHEIVEGGGSIPAKNVIKWTQGDEWGSGWTGVVYDASDPFPMIGSWPVDSLKLKMKVSAGTKDLRVQIESGDDGKVGTVFTPIDDNDWHTYTFALKDFTYQDNTSNFDTSAVTKIGIMAEGNSAVGNVILIEEWWTGNPDIDVVPPVAATGTEAFGGDFINTISWIDVAGEENEVYNIYYSENPITDLTAAGVEVVKMGVEGGIQTIDHVLIYPAVDASVSYYYAIEVMDAAGNKSELASTSLITNTAKGVAIIDPNGTEGFTADGNLSEWAFITPFKMFPSDGSGKIVTNQKIDGDADLSVLAYVAMDENYLYVAYDVEDDVVFVDSTKNTYEIDSPDLFIGLYDWHGESHTGYRTGLETDYHFRFGFNKLIVDNKGAKVVKLPGTADYSWTEKFPSGYVVEARMSWEEIRQVDTAAVLFSPRVGMRIPIDFAVNDADATGEREGILTYSANNEDKSYQDVSRWSYTWIGTETTVGVEDTETLPSSYSLYQNYPNPFNPTTNIKFTIPQSGIVSLKVYNVLGQEVVTLTNNFLNAGTHTLNFDASKLSSGVYIYQITAGNFVSTKKMMLIK